MSAYSEKSVGSETEQETVPLVSGSEHDPEAGVVSSSATSGSETNKESDEVEEPSKNKDCCKWVIGGCVVLALTAGVVTLSVLLCKNNDNDDSPDGNMKALNGKKMKNFQPKKGYQKVIELAQSKEAELKNGQTATSFLMTEPEVTGQTEIETETKEQLHEKYTVAYETYAKTKVEQMITDAAAKEDGKCKDLNVTLNRSIETQNGATVSTTSVQVGKDEVYQRVAVEAKLPENVSPAEHAKTLEECMSVICVDYLMPKGEKVNTIVCSTESPEKVPLEELPNLFPGLEGPKFGDLKEFAEKKIATAEEKKKAEEEAKKEAEKKAAAVKKMKKEASTIVAAMKKKGTIDEKQVLAAQDAAETYLKEKEGQKVKTEEVMEAVSAALKELDLEKDADEKVKAFIEAAGEKYKHATEERITAAKAAALKEMKADKTDNTEIEGAIEKALTPLAPVPAEPEQPPTDDKKVVVPVKEPQLAKDAVKSVTEFEVEVDGQLKAVTEEFSNLQQAVLVNAEQSYIDPRTKTEKDDTAEVVSNDSNTIDAFVQHVDGLLSNADILINTLIGSKQTIIDTQETESLEAKVMRVGTQKYNVDIDAKVKIVELFKAELTNLKCQANNTSEQATKLVAEKKQARLFTNIDISDLKSRSNKLCTLEGKDITSKKKEKSQALASVGNIDKVFQPLKAQLKTEKEEEAQKKATQIKLDKFIENNKDLNFLAEDAAVGTIKWGAGGFAGEITAFTAPANVETTVYFAKLNLTGVSPSEVLTEKTILYTESSLKKELKLIEVKDTKTVLEAIFKKLPALTSEDDSGLILENNMFNWHNKKGVISANLKNAGKPDESLDQKINELVKKLAKEKEAAKKAEDQKRVSRRDSKRNSNKSSGKSAETTA